MEQKLHVVTLGVEDLGRSTQFYERLGWKPSSFNKGVTFFQMGSTVLALYPRAAFAEDARLSADGAGFGGITLAHNVREREQVDAALVEAEAAGATILKPAEDVFWGGYSGYFADPDGYPWEVCWNPVFGLGEDGFVKVPV